MLKYQNNPLFNYLIDKNLCKLIQLDIDMNDYFESKLPIFEIAYEDYPKLHPDDRTIIKGFDG